MDRMTIVVFFLVSLVKTLFMKCYYSTDFEVHRNWLAITHSRPISQWYQDATSEWTLDYPPFFAWFECFLSQLAQYFDKEMLWVENLNHNSAQTIFFQRMSVIFADFVLTYGVTTCYQALKAIKPALGTAHHAQLMVLVTANAGLVLVDHIHFQYNGFLAGIAFHSIGLILQQHFIRGAFWFAVLLNFKHIYLYTAPVYFVYLLSQYCLDGKSSMMKFVSRLGSLGVTVIFVFAASFGPFIYMGQLTDVLQRLFPFKRGLCHAYWAPNFWALYNLADKMLTFVLKKLDFQFDSTLQQATMTGGLVQEFQHSVLFSVPPLATLILAVLAMLPVMVKLWNCQRNPVQFLRAIVLCNFASFLFGWHVHEKAILLSILPMILLAFLSKQDGQTLFILLLTGHVSLLPLIFKPSEAVIKILIILMYQIGYAKWITTYHNIKSLWKCFNIMEVIYMFGLMLVTILDSLTTFNVQMFPVYPFLPLLITSCYCAIGIIYAWFLLLNSFILYPTNLPKLKSN